MTTSRKLEFLLCIAAGVMALGSLSCSAGKPTAEEAKQFVEDAEARLAALSHDAGLAEWVQKTYIMHDTNILAAEASQKATAAAVELATEARRFDGVEVPADISRRLMLLRHSLPIAAPADPTESMELSEIMTRMESVYGSGKYCPEDGACMDLEEISNITATSRDPKRLAELWRGWRTISPPIKKDYVRYVELANKGAKELGFADTGAMWRSQYDMPPDEFAMELDRLWEQVKPLYLSLHAYVRRKLREKYGPDVVPADGPIPAHLLGNLWAQDWTHVYSLAARRTPIRGTTCRRFCRARRWTRRGWCGMARGFSLRWASLRCRRLSGSVRSSRNHETGRSFATPAPGTWTTSTICASRCASKSTPRTSEQFTMN